MSLKFSPSEQKTILLIVAVIIILTVITRVTINSQKAIKKEEVNFVDTLENNQSVKKDTLTQFDIDQMFNF
ncbi:MAG: hypothetical protein R3Y50_03685 [Rikenellaceae bacterium]